MSNIVERYVYFCGDKEYEYVISEENGVYTGKSTNSGDQVTAQTLSEAKEVIRQRVQNQNS